MLMLLVAASMTFNVPKVPQGMYRAADSLEQERKDTAREERTVTILKNGAFQEMPGFRTSRPSFFGLNRNSGTISPTSLDSLLRSHPALRGPLLEELLIPKGQPLEDPMQVALRKFNEQLVKDSKLTPFERMSLINKRQSEIFRFDNSSRWYQLDILGTIRWLEEALKE